MTVVVDTRVEDVDESARASAEAGPRLPDVPRRIGGPTRSGVLSLSGAVVSGLCVSVLLFGELAPFSGALGFAVTWYVVFLVVYGVLTGLEENGQAVRDRVMTVVLWTAAGLLFSALAMVVGFTLWRGREALTYLNFFHQDMQAAGPLDPLGVGGIAHAMVGTLLMITIALLITVPLGLACAVYLNQIPGRFSRFVRTIVEAMTALPSIVAGLMVYAVWVLQLGMEKSGLAAGFAISVMMLPIVIRAADVVLRLVPGTLTEAAEALGAPRWRTVWHVVLPTARSGLATAVILGTARGIGETSPVLLTAGFTAATNYDPLHGPMISLPLAVFSFVRSPEPAMIARGFGAAAVLMALVLVLFVIARVIGGRGPGQQTRTQARRTARASRRDATRFDELHAPGLSLFDAHPHESSATTPTPASEPPAPADGEPAPQEPPAPYDETVTNSARSGGEAGTESARGNHEPTATAHKAPAPTDGEPAPQEPPAPDDKTVTNSARSGGEAGTESARGNHEPTATAHKAPAPTDGEPAPQEPPAPDDKTVTNSARSGGEAGTESARGNHEPTATAHKAPAPTDGEPAPQEPPTPDDKTVTNSARSGGEAGTESAHGNHEPTATAHKAPAPTDGEPAPQEPPAPDDKTVTNSARSGGEAGTESAHGNHEPTATAHKAPAPTDGEPAPQEPPTPDDESVTGGAGGNENPAGGRDSAHRPAPDPAHDPAPGETD